MSEEPRVIKKAWLIQVDHIEDDRESEEQTDAMITAMKEIYWNSKTNAKGIFMCDLNFDFSDDVTENYEDEIEEYIKQKETSC